MSISPSWNNVGGRRGHSFAPAPQANIERSVFDRSHGHKTTINSGYLVPILADEVLPGDSFNLRLTIFGRLTTLLKPIIDNMYIETFFFFVPNRLIWTNFKKMMGEQANPSDSISYIMPTINTTGDFASGGKVTTNTLFDYLGIPANVTWGAQGCAGIRADWSRAYNLIWNEWFRDENLQNSVTVDTGDGPDTASNYVLLKRGRRHDYFTSCLPWAQKGTAVTLPLGTSAPVKGIGTSTQVFGYTNVSVYENGTGSTTFPFAKSINSSTADRDVYIAGTAASGVDPNVYADLSNATAATINALRLAFQTQAVLERDARGGTRYTELVRSHFGVVSPDARLQRPEYLGGGSTPINVSPIPQTSATSGSNYLGQLSAMGTVSGGGHGFVKSFTEHGVILGLACVRCDQTYQQGIERMFYRSTRYDFYLPSFANIGEQAVKLRELYAIGTTANDSTVWGYQEAWAELRYKPSRVSGQLNSNAATPLDSWHLALKFSSAPTLGDTFIKETPPIDRIVADTADPQLYLDMAFNYKCARPIPIYSTPFQLSRL